MKNIVFFPFLLISLVFFVACEDSVLPDLPDMDESVDVDAFEIGDEETEDDSDQTPADDSDEADVPDTDPAELPDTEQPKPEIAASHLLVATVGGYDVPMSGHVYYAKDEYLAGLKEIPVVGGMGSEDGADLNVAAFETGFAVLGRDKSSSIYFFTQEFGFEQEIQVKPDTYINMQDMAYNPFRDEFIVSALNSDTYDSHQKYADSIFVLKKGPGPAVSEFKISDNESASPAKMKIVGKKLFIALQNLNDKTVSSDKGEIAVVDLENYSVERVELPAKNPTGKIEYNAKADKKHIYFVATGNWQKRDGALLQMDIETYEVKKVISESDEENNILDGDFVDISLADSGEFFIIFSNNSSKWENNLLYYIPKEGKVYKIDSGLNAFAANPIDYSSVTGKIYYFVDKKSDTYLKALDSETFDETEMLLEYGPAALRVKYDYK